MATVVSVPFISRKKPVLHHYKPNSYRVISHEAETWDRPNPLHASLEIPNANVIGQPAETQALYNSHRQNRPNPNHVGFLRHDVRLLNEPVCDVYTDSTRAEQHEWWVSKTSTQPLKKPEHTLDTIVRQDYQYRGNQVSGCQRHTSNPYTTPARGIAPVNLLWDDDGKQRLWKEGISYEHQYNCRVDPQYPIRGNRHGAFVWDRYNEQDVGRMIDKFAPQRHIRPVTRPLMSVVNDSRRNSKQPSPPTQSPVTASAPKSAQATLESPRGSPVKEATVGVSAGKPLSRAKTESIISAVSQQKTNSSDVVKLPPIVAL